MYLMSYRGLQQRSSSVLPEDAEQADGSDQRLTPCLPPIPFHHPAASILPSAGASNSPFTLPGWELAQWHLRPAFMFIDLLLRPLNSLPFLNTPITFSLSLNHHHQRLLPRLRQHQLQPSATSTAHSAGESPTEATCHDLLPTLQQQKIHHIRHIQHLPNGPTIDIGDLGR